MNRQELLRLALKNNEHALAMIRDLAHVSQIWDDLIDKDKEVTPKAINETFIILLSSLPRNPFYQSHLNELQPIIESTIIDWLTANHFESEQKMLQLGWALRDNLAAVLICCAKIIGGLEWAIAVAPDVREAVHNETFEDWMNERR